MNDRPSAIVLLFRYFMTVFLIVFMISLFWNGLSGTNMFPFGAVIGVSAVLTVLFNAVGWIIVTLGGEAILYNDANFQKWKQMGGRPYWDSIGWPINTATPIERQTGLAEPEYTDFVPPADWRYQCPVCGSRCEKQIDVCWNCNYGEGHDLQSSVVVHPDGILSRVAVVGRFGPPTDPLQHAGGSKTRPQPPTFTKISSFNSDPLH